MISAVRTFGSVLAPLAPLANIKAAKALGLTALALRAISSIPTASAGGNLYFSCIQTCTGGQVDMLKAVLCPTICAPLLLVKE